jgi:putative addiction module component (TIGR02574 family)
MHVANIKKAVSATCGCGQRAVLVEKPKAQGKRALTASMRAQVMLQFAQAEGGTVMSKKGAELLEKALSLPPVERAELADRLLTSLDSSSERKIDELWAQEAEDRLEAFERGEIKAVPAKEAFGTPDNTKP